MPVPVPVYSKPPAHQVIKVDRAHQSDSKSSVFQHLTHSLPLPPQGPPPSLATREEWISSLPSWRRNKPRRIWEDESNHPILHQSFDQGLTVADNASVIKGEPAQASIPPLREASFAAESSDGMYLPREMDEEMSGYPASMRDWRSDDEYLPDASPVEQKFFQRTSTRSLLDIHMGDSRPIARSYSAPVAPETYVRYERGAFSPVLEDFSPEVAENFSPEPAGGPEPGSSPIGPATPFADYIDNAFAEAHHIPSAHPQVAHYPAQDGYNAACYQCQHYQAEQPAQPAPVTESVVAPVATEAYKKLAEPLSEWMVGFVWKVCTTGMRLSPEYAQPMAFVKHYPSSPPKHLKALTHSMLLSTLLQPSAIFLALWYVIRLPVFFGPVSLGMEHTKEMRFRAELLGEAHLGADRETIEAYAPFRLILLGCMLANKWLDDHTFSNKTWHTISNVPIRSLNRLEALALDIFKYDLTISPQAWTSWLSDIMAYHQALSSPMFPQPIGRPSSSPHVIIRQAIEMLIDVKPTQPICTCNDGQICEAPPSPVFVSLETHKKEKVDFEETYMVEPEIDLDEDGPLREEYLPRRRASTRTVNHVDSFTKAPERVLPPPAKWSPDADEPILRDHTRGHAQYVAPQPIPHLTMPPPPPPAPYQAPMEVHRPSWSVGGYVSRPEVIARPSAFAPPPPMYPAHVPALDYGYGIATATHPAHSRSHSLSYNHVMAEQIPGRLRSFSQTQYDHDIRASEAQYVSPPLWGTYDRIGFPTSYDRPFGLTHRPSLKA